ncbi:thioesterase family protein [Aestuariibacter sp. AA17]|uniref:Medium/long-chain acyl-CoA thioesterase YigI n=1 Tax=Fluctibacter corallii TaxID=2984329 RepID=A0ABT3AC18_9ALTE|nr:thioesterase family protein [Aestuariibacter sp. AA17]MCV2886221.1 thioesterase family protein [Aestuariibacter sp. AA17]
MSMTTPEETVLEKTKQRLAEQVIQFFQHQMPFNTHLGMQVSVENDDQVTIRLPWQNTLTGNSIHQILHGGVTASMLDTVGGLTAILHAIRNLEADGITDFESKFRNMGTIDMRVDYLRPGKGEVFIATAQVIRKGNKVAVCRMELHNESGTHIAFGTGTYMVG